MNYFMSDIHGANEAYFEMKNRIELKANDELYILGDIFDKNTKNPQANLDILDDIMKHDNIHLILGDHEYAHVMRYASQDNEDTAKQWEHYICDPLFQGRPFLKYFTEHLSPKEQTKYITYLISCEMSLFIKIGHRYFYLVHGSPVVCRQNDIYSWQKDLASVPINIQKNYLMAITSDPDIVIPKDLTKDNLFIIAGHIPTRYVFEDNKELMTRCYGEGDEDLPSSLEKKTKHQRIVLSNHKLLIDCGCDANTIGKTEDGWASDLSCVGIDAAGFFTEYLLQ